MTRTNRSLRPGLALVATGAVLAASGCGGGGESSGIPSNGDGIAIAAGDKSCQVAESTMPAGRTTFTVTNKGSGVTEVYVYADGDRVIGEVENIGPSTKRNLVVDLEPGSYQIACKPGMVGSGIRSALTVTGLAPSGVPLNAQLTDAVTGFRTYVGSESAALVTAVQPLAAAVKANDVATAKRLYPAARTHYERIEPIAESFGDLDPLIDERIDEVTAGQPFVGFHRLEQDLWKTGDVSKDGQIADDLLANTRKLEVAVKDAKQTPITPLIMANGAKSLLDEVAKSKVTGEEERYSHVDLVDFAANVEGSKLAYTWLRPVLAKRAPELVETLDTRFSTLAALLATHAATAADNQKTGNPYVLYPALSKADIKALATEVDALSEPLGQLAAALPVT